MLLQLFQHAVTRGVPDLRPLFDLLEQIFQRSRAFATAPPL
jgi:hypothetical protein